MGQKYYGQYRDSDFHYDRYDGYYCTECHELFWADDVVKEKHTEYHPEIGAWEEWDSHHCPNCGSEEIDTTYVCDCDRNLMRPKESMCEECLEACREGWAKAIELVAETRGMREIAARNFMNDYISYYEEDDFDEARRKKNE